MTSSRNSYIRFICKNLFISFQIFMFLHTGMLHASQREFGAYQLNVPDVEDGVVIQNYQLNNNWIDSHHKIDSNRGYNGSFSQKTQKILYILRQQKTRELLNGRKALLELLDPALEAGMYYQVPRNVKNIFTSPGREIREVQILIDQVESGPQLSNRDRLGNREKVFKELILISLNLNYMDKAIKFVVDEIWKNNESFERIWKDRQGRLCTPEMHRHARYGRGVFVCSHSAKSVKERVTRELIEEHGISELVQSMMAARLNLLNSYPMLAVKYKDDVTSENIEVYRQIYKRIEKYFEVNRITNILPDLEHEVDSNHIDFNSNREIEISMNSYIQEKLAAAIPHVVPGSEGHISLSRADRGRSRLIYQGIKEVFDIALVKQLDANTNFLRDLNSRISIDSNSDPYKLLVLNELNWQKMIRTFSLWMETNGILAADIEIAKTETIQRIERERFLKERRQRILNYISIGLFAVSILLPVIGALAVAGAIVLSSATIAALFTAGTISALLSGITFAAETILNHLDHKRFAELTRDLFISTRESSDYQTQHDSRIVADRSVTGVVMVAVIGVLFLRGPLAKIFGTIFQTAGAVSTGFVRLTAEQVEKIRNLVRTIRSTAIANFSLMKYFLAVAASIAFVPAQGIKLFLRSSMRASGMTKRALVNLLKRTPYYEGLMHAGTRELWRTEMFVEFLAAMVGEYLARGENFWDEIGYVMFNTVFALGVTTKIVFSSKGMRADQQRAARNDDMWDHVLGPKNTTLNNVPGAGRVFRPASGTQQRWGSWAGAHWRSTLKLGYEVSKVAVIMNTIMLSYKYIIHLLEGGEPFDAEVEEMLVNTLLTTGIMVGMVSAVSPAKSQWVYQRANPAIDRAFARAGLSNLSAHFRVPLSMGNNVIGTFSLASVLKASGIQGGHGGGEGPDFFEDFMYVYDNPNLHNAEFLYPYILNENLLDANGNLAAPL